MHRRSASLGANRYYVNKFDDKPIDKNIDKSINKLDNKPKQKTDFAKINMLNCSIKSLRNQLKAAKSIDELILITSKIIKLEELIANERLNGYQNLNKKRKDLENMLTITDSKQLYYELEHVINTLKYKINGYKTILNSRINQLSNDYDDRIFRLMLTNRQSTPDLTATI